jgi:hypothetical protein
MNVRLPAGAATARAATFDDDPAMYRIETWALR